MRVAGAGWGLALGVAAVAFYLGKRLGRHRRRGVENVARVLGMRSVELMAFVPRYRVARIRKRSGGTRVLHIPDNATKELQRRILRKLLSGFRAHPAAYGFEHGRSIAHAAAQHVGRSVVLHLDVENFFTGQRMRGASSASTSGSGGMKRPPLCSPASQRTTGACRRAHPRALASRTSSTPGSTALGNQLNQTKHQGNDQGK